MQITSITTGDDRETTTIVLPDDPATAAAKKLRENLPEDVQIALESMAQVLRVRKATPHREPKTYRYFEVT